MAEGKPIAEAILQHIGAQSNLQFVFVFAELAATLP